MKIIESHLIKLVLNEVNQEYPRELVKETFELYKKTFDLRKDFNKEMFEIVEHSVNKYLNGEKPANIKILQDNSQFKEVAYSENNLTKLKSSGIGMIVDKSKAYKTYNMNVTPFPKGSRSNPDYKR
jgi:hypothetical protein